MQKKKKNKRPISETRRLLECHQPGNGSYSLTGDELVGLLLQQTASRPQSPSAVPSAPAAALRRAPLAL